MTLAAPPVQQPLMDQGGGTNILWVLFFNSIFNGDAGVAWIPTAASLTSSSGVPTIAGRVYKISNYLTFFRFTIVPASGETTSSTAGTTYITNFPYVMSGDGVCADVSNKLGGTLGMCEQATNKIWLPAWTTISNPVSVIGIVEAS
jgi:hypothetical protein